MSKRFPDTPAFSGYDRPSRIECDVFDLEVDGELPREINGSWYRCGPDPQFAPFLGDDIYINGDGMVSMFRFDHGHVDFKMRYVQTERFLAERAARRSLYGRYRNSYTDDPRVKGMSRGTANTTPVWHGRRMLVLKEDDRPIEIDPVTLATLGSYDWGGKLRTKTVTAHPKIDPVTGELLFFGYEAEGDGSSAMAFCTADKHGRLVREEWFEPPYVAMVHDFAITRDYVVFPIMPTVMHPERLKAGGPHWVWDGSLAAWIGIMPRAGTVADLRWFKMPTTFAFHTINAFNDGTQVHVDTVDANRNAFPFIADITGAAVDAREGMPFATRWSFDMASEAEDGGFTERRLSEYPGELPLVNPRFVGASYRYAYIAMIDPSRRMLKAGPTGMASNMIGKLDISNGSAQTWYGDDETSYQEGAFIPFAGASGEDDGYYINVADRHDQNRSDLLVFDARRIDEGPIVTVRLPLRLRNAFHTTWVPT